MLKNKIIPFVLFVLLVIGFWNLADFLFTKFIVREQYQFQTVYDLLIPLTVGAVIGAVTIFRKDD
ncbi:MAG: hypothetical protein IJM85_02675 [Clostridia bacterium]|nr:hypothetical protein [Clostridia bacterium]